MPYRRFLASCIVLLLFVPSAASWAQPEDDITVGLGVSINSFPVVTATAADGRPVSLSPSSVSIPITSSSLRIEPEIGFSRESVSSEDDAQTQSTLTVGTGGFLVSRYDDARLLLGGRVGLSRRASSVEFNSEEETSSAIDFLIGPAIGGEYYLSDHFSMGVEARFLYVNLGAPDDAPDDFSATRLRTSAGASFRFHF